VGFPVFTGLPKTVTLVDGQIPSFTRYASHYGPHDDGIPAWHFRVTDDRSNDSMLRVDARLLTAGNPATEVVPFQPVPIVSGAGFNREIVISSAYYPDIANWSGQFQLEIRATDESLNISHATVSWQQTILPAPIRQRTAPGCDELSDLQCPAHYS